jgi:glutathione synthase
LAEGVVFIGFDVIGGFVSEINITSPRLLVGPGGEGDQYERIAALVEKDLGR